MRPHRQSLNAALHLSIFFFFFFFFFFFIFFFFSSASASSSTSTSTSSSSSIGFASAQSFLHLGHDNRGDDDKDDKSSEHVASGRRELVIEPWQSSPQQQQHHQHQQREHLLREIRRADEARLRAMQSARIARASSFKASSSSMASSSSSTTTTTTTTPSTTTTASSSTTASSDSLPMMTTTMAAAAAEPGPSSSLLKGDVELRVTPGASIGLGQYLVEFALGTPAQSVAMIADTGSDLAWVRCSSCQEGGSSSSCNKGANSGNGHSNGNSNGNSNGSNGASIDNNRASSSSRGDDDADDADGGGEAAFIAQRSSTYSRLGCEEAECQLVPGPADGGGAAAECECAYEYSYADSSVTAGVLSRDWVSLRRSPSSPSSPAPPSSSSSSSQSPSSASSSSPPSPSSPQSSPQSSAQSSAASSPQSSAASSAASLTTMMPNVSFGCSTRSTGASFAGAGGVLGLGRGPISLVAQAGAVGFSYCLPEFFAQPAKASQLKIFAAEAEAEAEAVVFTPMVANPYAESSYFVGVDGVRVGGELLPVPPSTWAIDSLGNGGLLVDSGTTLTVLRQPAYRLVLAAFARRLAASSVPTLPPPLLPAGFDLCFNSSRFDLNSSRFSAPDDHRLSSILPTFLLHLPGGISFQPPSLGNVFIDVSDGVKCLGLRPSDSFSVLGNLLHQNFRLVFDLRNSRLGFSPGPTRCA